MLGSTGSQKSDILLFFARAFRRMGVSESAESCLVDGAMRYTVNGIHVQCISCGRFYYVEHAWFLSLDAGVGLPGFIICTSVHYVKICACDRV